MRKKIQLSFHLDKVWMLINFLQMCRKSWHSWYTYFATLLHFGLRHTYTFFCEDPSPANKVWGYIGITLSIYLSVCLSVCSHRARAITTRIFRCLAKIKRYSLEREVQKYMSRTILQSINPRITTNKNWNRYSEREYCTVFVCTSEKILIHCDVSPMILSIHLPLSYFSRMKYQ